MMWRFLAVMISVASLMGAKVAPEPADEFTLSKHCPAGFELVDDNSCILRSLYQQYSAPEGFGGLRTPLPAARDGFSPQEIDLGRYLFFDPVLSGDKTQSCAHCHHPDLGFADARGRSIGVGGNGVGPDRKGGKLLPRGAPSLWNMAFQKKFFWDSRADSLEEQALGPLLSPDEMAGTEETIEADLNANATYRRLFAVAYPSSRKDGISITLVTHAIAAFEATLISLNSPYDRYAHGDQNALNTIELEGHNIFRSFVTRCSQCHTPPLFTNGELAVIGSPEPEGVPLDPGVQDVKGDPVYRGAFKIPSLRNISLTAPYMHSGRFSSLEEVVDFYNEGRGNAVPPGEKLHLHWHIVKPDLTAAETKKLVAFLRSLIDESMKPEIPPRVPSGLPVVPSYNKYGDPS